MGKKKFTPKQRLEILAEHDAGASVAALCRKHQISPATLYNWKKAKTVDGCPAYIRCDNGPEFISKQLQEWAEKKQY